MTVFNRIKILCKEKGIKIREMERDLNMSQNASYKWKEYSPSNTKLIELAEYFGVTPEFILTGNDGKEADIKDTLDGIILSLKTSNSLTFNGNKLDAFSKQMLITNLENILDVSDKYFSK